MTAIYNSQVFHTPLLARWAAFFDLANWSWSTNVLSVDDWKPDFRVSFECGHSECSGSHTILVTVLSIDDVSEIKGHPALSHVCRVLENGKSIADAGAVFGSNPKATRWQMAHGAGGGVFAVPFWVEDATHLWDKAGQQIRQPAAAR